MKSKRGVVVFITLLLVLIIGSVGAFLGFITDFLWFKEMNYTSVFLTELFSQIKLGIPTFIILTVLIILYLRTIKHDYYTKMETVDSSISEKTINRIVMIVAMLFSLAVTLMTTTRLWYEIMSFLNSSSFNTVDPIFGKDVSFYIFTLPLANQIYQIAIMIVMLFAVLTFIYYLFLMSVRRPKLFQSQFDKFNQYETNENDKYANIKNLGQNFFTSNWKELLNLAIRQIAILAAVFFLIVGAGYFLKQYELLYSSGGVVYGARFVDINITLWQYRILMFLAVASAFLFSYGILKKKYKLALVAPALMILVTLAGNGIAIGVQNFIVAPDEISKETEYIDNNIKMTQKAYGLDQIEERPFTVDNNLTGQDIANNKATIKNIRINDFEPSKQFYNQRQSIRQYYAFNDVDVDRYIVNGEYSQVFLSAREIDEAKIYDQWITKHLKYTHGYGLTLSQVNSITASGQPDILIENLPPQSKIPEIQITRPEIYFGEMTNNYIIVNTDEEEFDYPLGEKNTYNTYEGNAGIKLGPINRLLFSIREASMKMLVSTNINSDSKIVIYRNIKERMQKIAPFLSYDDDPYLVVDEGRLYWMADAYTTSSYYPYSEPFNDGAMNYIRNSVKVVIDAYNGDVHYYVVDKSDPMANTLQGIFPELFRPISEMQEGLKAHVRYPKALFEIQANVYQKYHMNDAKVFYQGEDLWGIANEIYGQEEAPMTSNYYIINLPGEKKEEFILSLPYTPVSKNNMTGLLVARNDGENYGKMICYKLPKDKTVYGPMQIEAQIDQDTTISKEFSLWSQRGSSYLRGNIFVIPIENSLLYVEPIYLQSSNESSLPEVKRVIAAYGDKIAYEKTLGKALESLFGTDIGKEMETVGEVDLGITTDSAINDGSTSGNEVLDIDELIQLANKAFENATAAQQAGDWAGYGKYIEELKTYLSALGGEQGTEESEEDPAIDSGTSSGAE